MAKHYFLKAFFCFGNSFLEVENDKQSSSRFSNHKYNVTKKIPNHVYFLAGLNKCYKLFCTEQLHHLNTITDNNVLKNWLKVLKQKKCKWVGGIWMNDFYFNMVVSIS